LIAVPTLDCLAYSYSEQPGLVLPVLDAKKGCFFASFYRNGKRLTDFLDACPVELAKIASKIAVSGDEMIFLTGQGAELFQSKFEEFYSPENISIDPEFARGRAKELLEIAKNTKLELRNDIEEVPVYLRKSDAELNYIKDGGNK
jgi:tRNA threonylcarbamoyladenosine biosynthesis protein TsaB